MRIALAVAAIGCTAYMWVKKDIVGVFASMNGEELAPVFAANAAVSLVKLAALAAAFIVKRIVLAASKRDK